MDRKTQIIKNLNIEQEELTPVLLLIIQSIFIGIFYGAFDIGAHTLFLKAFPEDMIAKAYIVSGVVGIVLTGIFSRMQSRVSFSTLAKYTLLFVAVLTFVMRIAFLFTDSNWPVLVVFILLGPLNILAILAFWGTVGRIFNLRQGKRLFGIIDAGQIFGIILSSFIIPLVIVALKRIENLLLISAVSIFFAMFLEIIISYRYKIDREGEEEKTDAAPEEQVGIKGFVKNKYILYMALFVIFSMFAAFFVQYSFLVVTKENYPEEQELAKFLGFFTGAMMVFTLLVKTFVYGKLMKAYGLKVSLLLSSVLLALFTGIAILTGYISGYEIHSSGFIYFFLFIALGKLFNKTLKDALEGPSFKILYQSLPKMIRFDVQAKIDGTVNEISALVSGILLSVLGALAFVQLIHFSIVLLVLLLIWTYITIKLYHKYRYSLESALSDTGLSLENTQNQVGLAVADDRHLLLIKRFQPDLYPAKLETYLVETAPHSSLDFELQLELYMLYLNGQLPVSWKEWYDRIKVDKQEDLSANQISYAFSSKHLPAACAAILFIQQQKLSKQHILLATLLRMREQLTRITALKLCAYLKQTELIPAIAELAGTDAYMADAHISLQRLVSGGYKQMMQVYYRTDISEASQLVLIDVLQYSKEASVQKFLLHKLSEHRKSISQVSLNGLDHMAYTHPEEKVHELFPVLAEKTKVIAWNYAALECLYREFPEDALHLAVQEEINQRKAELFRVLKLCYDRTSVGHVEKYITENNSDSIGYGLELFDLFLAEEIKSYIMLVYEEISLSDKVTQFQEFFAVPQFNREQVILALLNRDVNLISRRVKKLALMAYATMSQEICLDVVAQLFSPDAEFRDMAARIIHNINPLELNVYLDRLSKRSRMEIRHNAELGDAIHTFKEVYDKKQKLARLWGNQSVYETFELFKAETVKKTIEKSHTNKYFVFLKDYQIEESDDFDLALLDTEELKGEEEAVENSLYYLAITDDQINRMIVSEKKYVEQIIHKIL